MSKADLIPKAEQAYVEYNYTLAQISLILNVSLTTLSKWKQNYNWTEKRDKFRRQPLALSQMVSEAIHREFTAAMKEGFNPGNVDMLNKLASMQSKVGGVDDFPSSAILVMNDFIKYVMSLDLPAEIADKFFAIIQDYVGQVGENAYGRDV